MEALLTLIGRFHSLVVHFPIAILLMAIVFELLAKINSMKKLKAAVQPTLFIGALTSVISVCTGLILAQEGGYDEELLSVHKYLGLSTTALAFIVFFLRRQTLSIDKAKRKQIRLMLLIPVVILVSLTGHWGGSLTHGEDYFFEFTEDAITLSTKIKLPPADSINNAVMYTEIIVPILESKCYSCHGERRQKGELRLDSKENILRGGKHGDVVTLATPDSSSLYYRLLLPYEDKKHMPPEEKPQLSSAEIDLIHSWVNGGSSFEAKVIDFSDRAKIVSFVRAIQSVQEQKSWVPNVEVASADRDAIHKLADKGILVIPVADGSNYLMANFINARESGDDVLELLLPIKDQLLWLNLERTKISDQGMTTVGKLTELRILYLNNTAVGDPGVKSLNQLTKLSYLNLVGTSVSDRAVPSFTEMKALEHLYLANTSVSSPAIRDLVDQNKKISIDTGKYSLPSLPSDTVVYRRKN